jgi:hypothetical protein
LVSVIATTHAFVPRKKRGATDGTEESVDHDHPPILPGGCCTPSPSTALSTFSVDVDLDALHLDTSHCGQPADDLPLEESQLRGPTRFVDSDYQHRAVELDGLSV